MAAVLDPQDAAAKNGSQVDEQLAQATSRIRAHDLAFGALVLVSLALVYTTAMILLDKYLALPGWVRQVALLGFVGSLAATAYFTVVSPLRKKINPLYAARQVESTLDDPKNSVTGYVDAQQKGELNATVKAALARRAALATADADVNKAVDHRSLLWLGGVAIALCLVLAAMFFVFRPAQFGSLVGRTFNPFATTKIESRTQITLLKPEPADATITTGQSVSVAVHVAGKVPGTDGPDRMRLMIRHNPLDPNYTELPLVQGNTNRDWELRVPDHLVQNGFWYKIAGGDDQTEEHKVTVRSLPLFTDFQATYEYLKYLRRKPETANDPIIKAYRGTTVTLVARTNREVRDGTMTIEPGGARVPGTAVAGKPDSVQFQFKVTEPGRYKLTFAATNGERSADPFQSTISVEADSAPLVGINKPEPEIIDLPTNGQLAIDGKVGDDFGVDTITLKMKIVSPVERPLPDKPFLNGKSVSFRRAKDDTWPTDVDYKDSVDLAKLTKDAAGVALELAPETVIEYWLEAADNCTEPKANVGRSAPKRVRLTPPAATEPDQKNLDNQKADRKNEEDKNNAQQQQKFEKENRDPQQKNGDQPQKQDGKTEPKPGEKGEGKKDPEAKGGENGDPKDGTPKEGEQPKGGQTDPMGNPPPMGGEQPKSEPKKGMDNSGTGGKSEPMKGGTPDAKQENTTPPSDPMTPNMGTGQPESAPPPKTMDEKAVQEKADKLNEAIKKENSQGGAAKPPNEQPAEQERTDPAQAKPQPMGGDKGNMAEPKPEPKAGEPKSDPANPMKGDATKPADAKPEGTVEKQPDPATPKPADAKQPDPMSGQKPAAPSEARSEPTEKPPAGDKPEPKEAQPDPKNGKDPNQKQDPKSGASAKPSENSSAGGNSNDKRQPEAAGKPKPTPDQNRGGEKPSDPKDTAPGDEKPEAGTAKPEKAPPAGANKPAPKEDMMNPGGGGMNAETKPEGNANEPKPKGTGAAANKPDDKKDPPMPGGAAEPGVEKGTDKPDPKDAANKPQGGAGDNAPKQKELTEAEKKELEQAAKDLTNPDPKKRDEARKKIDNAIGEEKRKEVEQIANDLNSPDKDKREAAEKKFNEMKKQIEEAAKKDGKDGGAGQKKDGKDAPGAKKEDKKDGKGGGAGDKKDAPKLDEKQMKEISDAVKDLQTGDEKQKETARQKLDKMVGEDKRKEAEQLAKDLQSPDKNTRDAAQKKLEDMKKELEQQGKNDGKPEDGKDGKGKEPTPEEIADLAKKAQDLQSPDDQKRQQAEKELDDKLGKENREQLQKDMKIKKPGDMEGDKKLKDDVEKMAKEQAKKHDPTGQPVGSGAPVRPAMEEDAKNRLKSAELRLDGFEKKRYDEAFQKKQGFTEAEYKKFLDDYAKHVDGLRADAAKAADKPPPPPTTGPVDAAAAINGSSAGKQETRPGTSSGTTGGATVAPPGFEGARDKFDKLINPKK